jgi:thymidylate kinase
MNEIKLFVKDENLETLMIILKNLKPELVINLEVNGKKEKTRATQYQPKTNRIIKEQDSGVNDSSGKYINPLAYKQRLKKK